MMIDGIGKKEFVPTNDGRIGSLSPFCKRICISSLATAEEEEEEEELDDPSLFKCDGL